LDKYGRQVATRVARADTSALDRSIDLSAEAIAPIRRMSAWQRKAVLRHVAERCRGRAEELAQVLTVEAGKPIQHARGEVTRLVDTLDIAAEESTRIDGEFFPLDISQRADGYRGMWKRVPLGH